MNNKLYLYIGLSVLVIAFAVKWLGGFAVWFYILLGVAILFKAIFLINIFRKKGGLPNIGFYIILTGVIMILTSLLFKKLIPVPMLQKALFAGAVAFKVSGLVIMITGAKKIKKETIDISKD